MVVLIDTHRLVNALEAEYGFTPDQAEGVKFAIQEIDLNHVAKKSDIDRLRVELFKWLVPLLIGQIVVFTGIVSLLMI
ncbi:MAG: hypothetical protein AAFN77_18165 [Planctomycetota bacterium]